MGLIGTQFRRLGIRLQQPGCAIRVVAPELFVFFGAEVAGPHHARAVDVGAIVDPLVLENVLWPITHEDELFPW